MRHPIFILTFFIFCFTEVKANRIDSLKTGKDIEKFIASLYQEKYKDNYYNYYTFHLHKPDSIRNLIPCDSTIKWKSDEWKKTDFNKDGLTDLFAIVYQQDTVNSPLPIYTVYVVIDLGNNQFQLNEIPEYLLIDCYSVRQISVDDTPCLLYRHYKSDYTWDTLPGVDTIGLGTTIPHMQKHYFEAGRTDTLIYKFGGFIELNKANKDFPAIESIYFETTGCFGNCPAFSLNIFKDGTADFRREEHIVGDSIGSIEPSGNFRGTINSRQLNEIIGLIKYINAPDLENDYSVECSDMATSKLNIYFSNGSVKKISDYGLQGTLGLVRLYDLLFALRYNQKWE